MDGGIHHPGDDLNLSADGLIRRLLRSVREHLGLDVGFIGEFIDGKRVFRYVDVGSGVESIAVGDSDPLDDSYCYHVVAGQLPRFLRDPMQHPLSASFPVTQALPVGTHLSVPIRFSDGRTYGTFCCYAFDVRDKLPEDQLQAVEMIAELAGEQLEAIDAVQREARQRRALVETILADPAAITVVFQPLIDLQTMDIVALEALARFPGHNESPEWFFSQAAQAGLSQELEMLAVRRALAVLGDIPAPIRLNINVGPAAVTSEEFFEAVAEVDPGRLVVEVTEHVAIDDYTELKAASARLTALGIWLAIDDVGMGFSGLNRILESSPEELKLDRAVIRGCDSNPTKQALIEAFTSFGHRAGYNVVAEGIETEEELVALRSLNVKTGQGYHLRRPDTLDAVLAYAAKDRCPA